MGMENKPSEVDTLRLENIHLKIALLGQQYAALKKAEQDILAKYPKPAPAEVEP